MKLKLGVGIVCIACLVAQASFAVVVGGDDLDGGLTGTRVLNPDNTADNGEWPTGNERDYFGIGTVDINGDNSCALSGNCDLNVDIIDESLWDDPGDQSGIILATDANKKFLIADLEGGHNATSPRGTGEWTFDISGFNNLSIGIEMAQIGEFGQEDRGPGGIVSDRYTWSYQIDGGTVEPLMDLQAANSGMGDGAGWVATMADGNSYLAGVTNFFFENVPADPPAPAEGWSALECELGVAGSCLDEYTDPTFGDILRPAQLDTDEDGFIYLDVSASTISDTPSNPGDLMEDAMMMYEEENFFSDGCGAGGFDCFQQAERNLFRNPLLVNGGEALNNQLREFVADVMGEGSELKLFFEAENYGGARFFAFDNIVVNGDEVTALDGDYDDNGLVGAGDLGLVLATWGSDMIPPEWVNQIPAGSVGAAELSVVLSEWGNMAAPPSVPEPSSIVLVLLGMAMLARRRR